VSRRSQARRFAFQRVDGQRSVSSVDIFQERKNSTKIAEMRAKSGIRSCGGEATSYARIHMSLYAGASSDRSGRASKRPRRAGRVKSAAQERGGTGATRSEAEHREDPPFDAAWAPWRSPAQDEEEGVAFGSPPPQACAIAAVSP
jgi:hypothetical protein